MDFAIEQDEGLVNAVDTTTVGGSRLSEGDATPSKSEQTSKSSEPKNDGKDVNKYFEELEDTVSKQFDKTSKVLKDVVKEREDGYELNLGLTPETTEKAQQYLLKIDENLAQVENLAQTYWQKMSLSVTNSVNNVSTTLKEKNVAPASSFWSSWGSTLSNVIGTNEEDKKDGNVKVVGGNRTELELRRLETDKTIYTDNKLPLDDKFDIDAKTEDISKLLEENKNLEKLMNELVPGEVSYKDFWNIYYLHQQNILKMEETRKKILEEKLNKKKDEEEEIGWDDDDEEDDNNDDKEKGKNQTTKAEKTQSKSTNEKSIKTEAKSKNETKTTSNPDEKEKKLVSASAGDEEDEEDDDWE